MRRLGAGTGDIYLIPKERPWLRMNWGERNFGFDSLKSRSNRHMEEKGIVAWDSLPPEPGSAGGGAQTAGLWRETIPGNSRGHQSPSPPCRGSVYFRLTWEWKNQRRQRTRQSFEIHNIIRMSTQLLAVIIYILFDIDISI